MKNQRINDLVNAFCVLRDRQYAVYAKCAAHHGLTVNELFVLDILWFSPDGCTQTDICRRLSANKQTIAAITGRFLKKDIFVCMRSRRTGAASESYSPTREKPMRRT